MPDMVFRGVVLKHQIFEIADPLHRNTGHQVAPEAGQHKLLTRGLVLRYPQQEILHLPCLTYP
jgi:hypothetical protein